MNQTKHGGTLGENDDLNKPLLVGFEIENDKTKPPADEILPELVSKAFFFWNSLLEEGLFRAIKGPFQGNVYNTRGRWETAYHLPGRQSVPTKLNQEFHQESEVLHLLFRAFRTVRAIQVFLQLAISVNYPLSIHSSPQSGLSLQLPCPTTLCKYSI